MIKCPKCNAITITKTQYDVYVCHGCGNKWNVKEYKNGK